MQDTPPQSSYEQTVSDIRANVRFEGWLLVQKAEMRATANGKRFLDLSLVDRTGAVPAKWWDYAGEPPAVGTVVRVRGLGNEYNGHLQLRIDSLAPARPEDGRSAADFVPAAPETPESMLAEVSATAAALRDPSLRAIVLRLLASANEGGRLLSAPAAKSMHHATLGGLLHHTVMMLRVAKAVAGVYRFLDKDLLFAGVIAHDLGKLDEMNANDLGLVDGYTRDGRLVGHIVRGVVNIERAAAVQQVAPVQAVRSQATPRRAMISCLSMGSALAGRAAEHSMETLFPSARRTIRLAVLPLTVAKREATSASPRKAARSSSR